MAMWTPHTLNTVRFLPSALRRPGNQRHDLGSWHSVASTSITNVSNPRERESLAPVSVFLISSGRVAARRWESRTQERQGQQFPCECVSVYPLSTTPQLQYPVAFGVSFSLLVSIIMTPCPPQNLKNPIVSNSGH